MKSEAKMVLSFFIGWFMVSSFSWCHERRSGI